MIIRGPTSANTRRESNTAPQQRAMYYRRITGSATLEYDCPIALWLQALEECRAEE